MPLSFKNFINVAKNSPAEVSRPRAYLKNHSSRFYETYLLVNDLINDSADVLSVGAGRAFVEFAIAKERNAKISVFDFQEAINRNMDQYTPYNFSTYAGNFLEDTDLIGNKKYDLILFCEIIEHIPVPPKDQIQTLLKYLKPGGYLVISTPNIASSNSLMKLINSKNIIAPAEKLFSPVSAENEHVHRREYIMKEVSEACRQCDMKVISEKYIFMSSPQIKPLSLLQYVFLCVLKKFRPMMLLAAQKNAS
ncbi:MAG: methyltransferase domain-containing protein [Hyphomicrobiales bacterium]